VAEPPQKSRLEMGFLSGEPEKAFFDEAHRILLGPFRSADPMAVADRRRLMEFIALTLTYLKMMGAGDRFTDKLMVYYAALRDLDLGVTSPILMARGLSHAAPLSSEIWRLRAILAVALDYLVRAGEPLEDAARKVARTPGIKRLLSGQARDAKASVKKWRGSLHRGALTNDAARMAWMASREKLASIDGPKGFKDEAARLIAVVRDDLVR
jgi:hypothetical protein